MEKDELKIQTQNLRKDTYEGEVRDAPERWEQKSVSRVDLVLPPSKDWEKSESNQEGTEDSNGSPEKREE